MYQIVISGAALPVATLVEALHAFHHDERFGSIDSADIQLLHDGAPIKVLRYNGELAIRPHMPPATLIAAMLDEARDRWFSRGGAPLKPYEVRRADWELLFWFSLIVRKEALLASIGVLERERFEARSRGENFRLEDVCRDSQPSAWASAFAARWSKAVARPTTGTRSMSRTRCSAIWPCPARCLTTTGRVVSAALIGRALMDVPALRGAIPAAKLRWLVPVMQRDGKAITAENARTTRSRMPAPTGSAGWRGWIAASATGRDPVTARTCMGCRWTEVQVAARERGATPMRRLWAESGTSKLRIVRDSLGANLPLKPVPPTGVFATTSLR
jgi:hypothetical protein